MVPGYTSLTIEVTGKHHFNITVSTIKKFRNKRQEWALIKGKSRARILEVNGLYYYNRFILDKIYLFTTCTYLHQVNVNFI